MQTEQLNLIQTPKDKSIVTLDDFSMLTVIGKGSYAKVVLVKRKGNQKVYAMKILKKDFIQKKKQQAHIKTQRDVLVEVSHPFIITMHNAFQSQKKLFFVLDFCPGGELFGLLSKRGKFSEQQTRFYAAQIVLALEYLHSKDIIYRDLKPENVLIDEVGYLRLTDFGLSKMKVKDSDAMSIVGTPEYLAPEIILKEGHGKPVDWWCLGSIIFEMASGLPPFYSKNRNQLFDKIKHGKANIPNHLSNNLKNLLNSLFEKKPQDRLGTKGAQQIRKHPWFQKINWQLLLKKQIKAPFVPNLKSQVDVSHIDPEFTECQVQSYSDSLARSHQSGKNYFDFSYDKDKEINVHKMEIQEENGNGAEVHFEMKEEGL